MKTSQANKNAHMKHETPKREERTVKENKKEETKVLSHKVIAKALCSIKGTEIVKDMSNDERTVVRLPGTDKIKLHEWFCTDGKFVFNNRIETVENKEEVEAYVEQFCEAHSIKRKFSFGRMFKSLFKTVKGWFEKKTVVHVTLAVCTVGLAATYFTNPFAAFSCVVPYGAYYGYKLYKHVSQKLADRKERKAKEAPANATTETA